MALNKRQYVDGQTVITAANLNEIQDCIITLENNYVPKTRTVAGKALSSNITLAASDVGAVPTSRTINSKALTGNITLSAADVGAVPVARTVNNKALSSNITLSAADVSAVPTTRTVNSKALSADISLTASDVGAVPTSRTVNGKALSANVTLASSDIGDDSSADGATVKASLNNLKDALDGKIKYYFKQATSTTSTASATFCTINDSDITANSVVLDLEFITASNDDGEIYIHTPVRWTSSSGSISLQGYCANTACLVNAIVAIIP